MKKIILLFGLLFFVGATAQNNPVNNLTWDQIYNFGYYSYTLQWEEPSLPHNELMGYNIYRDDQLYRFQTETYLTNMGPNPNAGQDFMNFDSNSDGFQVHVTAVYNTVESGFLQTVEVANNLLGTPDFQNPDIVLYPNPTQGIVYLNGEKLSCVMLLDVSGRKISDCERSSEINLSSHAKGVYFIKCVTQNGKTAVRRIVLQ